MPVTDKSASQETLYQRDQYAKGGLGRLYWDYRDGVALSALLGTERVILDVGCGEGLTLERLVKRFPESEVVGIDRLEENVEICRSHGLPARKGDVYDIDLPDDSVDAVLLFEVIEHLERPEEAIGEVGRVLKPGGRLVLIFPNDFVFKVARLATLRFEEARYDPGHVRQWTPRSVREALVGSGLEVCFVRNTPFFLWSVSLHCIMAGRKRGP